MFERLNAGQMAQSLKVADDFAPYSKVVISLDDENETTYEAGTSDGRTLELTCPWGTQAMADNILSDLRGYSYKPYSATGAILDPAFELGDSISIGNVYGGIFKRKLRFGANMLADVSAPGEEEVDHEYPYKPSTERSITRKLNNATAQLRVQNDLISAEVSARTQAMDELYSALSVQADRITAEVSERNSAVADLYSALDVQAGEINAKVSATSTGTFSWTLSANSWTLKSNGSTVLRASASGVEVTGKITATSGKIGGFTIQNNYLSTNGQEWYGTNTSGIYIGPNGIQLGNNFRVDSQGNLSAQNGTFNGYVRANMISAGGDAGYINGGQIGSNALWDSNLMANALTTRVMGGGINTSLGYADLANLAFNGLHNPTMFSAYTLNAGTNFNFKQQAMKLCYKNVMLSNGEVGYLAYLGAY